MIAVPATQVYLLIGIPTGVGLIGLMIIHHRLKSFRRELHSFRGDFAGDANDEQA